MKSPTKTVIVLCSSFLLMAAAYIYKENYKIHAHQKGDTYHLYEIRDVHGEAAFGIGDTLCIYCVKDSSLKYAPNEKIVLGNGIRYSVKKITDTCGTCPGKVPFNGIFEKVASE